PVLGVTIRESMEEGSMKGKFSIVVSVTALIVALLGITAAGGAAYKSHAKVAKAAGPAKVMKKKPKVRRGPRGLRGLRGPAGPAGSAGPAGPAGTQGPPGPFPTTLPAGKTLTGAWSVAGHKISSGDFVDEG